MCDTDTAAIAGGEGKHGMQTDVSIPSPQSDLAVDLPVDIWAIVREGMTAKQWAGVCATCRATNALKRVLLLAEAHKTGLDLGRQLQLDRWHLSQSLCLNLEHMHGEPEAPHINLAGSKLPLLQCLHIIGNDWVPLTQSSIEGVLVSLLAGYASVLTLQIKTLMMPLKFPNLEHLLLDLNRIRGLKDDEWTHEGLFPAIGTLKGLKTLYLQSQHDQTTVRSFADLRACVRLQHVAVQGVLIKDALLLPAETSFHANSKPIHVYEVRDAVAKVVTGLTLRGTYCREMRLHADYSSSRDWPLESAPHMANLKHLRLTLDKAGEDERRLKDIPLDIFFHGSPGDTPALEVLELDVQCSLSVLLCPSLKLKTLVLVSKESVWVHVAQPFPPQRPDPMSSLKHIFLQSGAALKPEDKRRLECFAEGRLLDHVQEGQGCWTARVPDKFNPVNLRECCCNACSACLARAGVPILCEQAWTSDGFDKHLGPYCSRAPSG